MKVVPRPRALVVDDYEDARALYVATLDLAGFVTMEAEDGPGALQLVASSLPDVIVLDVSMPGMSGWEVLARLRGDERTRRTPVVIVTGSGFAGRPREDDGCSAYLLKPCSPSRLVAVVRSVLTSAKQA